MKPLHFHHKDEDEFIIIYFETYLINGISVTYSCLFTKESYMKSFYALDTFNKLGYKAKINTHITSCIN